MSWLGGSISSLTGQLSNLTKDILTEGTEEVSDHVTELRIAQEKIKECQTIITSQKSEIDRLLRLNHELEEKAESSELQINSISREYRSLLQEKEKEINSLKETQHEIIQHQLLPAARDDSFGSNDVRRGYDSDGYHCDFGEEHLDFSDNISMQHEINRLTQEIRKLQAEVKHWKGQKNSGEITQQNKVDESRENVDLERKIKELEESIRHENEEHQHEVASLQDVHAQKMATLRKKLKAEITELKENISTLEEEKVTAITEKEELEHKLVVLSKQSVEGSDEDSRVTKLQSQLEEKEKELSALRMDYEKAQSLELLSDIHEVRRQMNSGIKIQREAFLQEKQDLVNQLIGAGIEQKDLRGSIEALKCEQEKVSLETDAIVNDMGRPEHQKLTKDIMDTFEKENLVLKKKNLEQQEQITLLERAMKTVTEERAISEASRSQGDGESHGSMETADADAQSMTSDLSVLTSRNKELDAQVAKLQQQISQYEQEIDQFELVKSDWISEKEALEDVLIQMREQLREKETSLNILEAQKGLVEAQKQGRKSINAKKDKSGILGNKALEMTEDESDSELSDSGDISEDIEKLDHKVELLTQANADLELERDQMLSEKNKLQEEIDSIKDQGNTEEFLTLKEQINTLETEKAALEETISECKGLEQLLEEKDKELEDVTNEKEALESSLEELDSQHQEAMEQVIQIRNDLQKNIQTLNMELDDKNDQMNKMKSEIETLQRRVKASEEEAKRFDELEEELFTMRDRNEELEINLKKAQAEVQGNISNRTEKLKNDGELESKLKRIEEKANSLSKINLEKENEIEEMKEKLQNSAMALNDLHMDIKDFEKKVKEKDKILTEKSEKLKSLREHNIELKNKITELEKSLESAESVINLAKDSSRNEGVVDTEMTNLQKQLDEKTEEMNSVVSELEGVNTHLADYMERYTKLQMENSDLLCKLSDRDNQILEMKDSFKSEYENAVKELEARMKALSEEKEESEGLLQQLEETLESRVQNSRLDLESKIESLREEKSNVEKEMAQLEVTLEGKVKHYENYIQDLQKSQEMDVTTVRQEHQRLMQEGHEKDMTITTLEGEVLNLKTYLEESEDNVKAAQQQIENLTAELSEKESEISNLNQKVGNLMEEQENYEDQSKMLRDLENLNEEAAGKLKSLNQENKQLQHEIESLQNMVAEKKQNASEMEMNRTVITELEEELSLANEKIVELKAQESKQREIIQCHEKGIEDLNNMNMEQCKQLKEEQTRADHQEGAIAVLQQSVRSKEEEISTLQRKMNRAVSLVDKNKQDLLNQEEDFELPTTPTSVPAIEYPVMKAIEQKSFAVETEEIVPIQAQHSYLTEESLGEETDSTSIKEDSSVVEKMEEMQALLKEKDQVIAELQTNNSSILKMLETKTVSLGGDKSVLDVHRLENEVRSLKLEKEQILSVMNEKSRESSNLKSEVHRLMNVISAEKVALEKLQQDNNDLMRSRDHEKSPVEEMQKDALQNLSRIIRDKDVEIEALKQKNETLLAVLQETSSEGSQMSSLMKDKDNLSQQLAALQGEREQMITYLNQKHQESLAYHNEIQRLSTFISAETEKNQQVQQDYANLVPQFEDKKQLLLKAQNELINHKQKFTELELKYGELLQRSNASGTIDMASYNSKSEEVKKLQEKQQELVAQLNEKEQKLQSNYQQSVEFKDTIQKRDSEISNLKKQIENLNFNMVEIQTKLSDLTSEHSVSQQHSVEQSSQLQILKETNNRLTLALQEKEFEVSTLQEKSHTLSELLQSKEGEQSHVKKMMAENEMIIQQAKQLQQERDQALMALKQRQTDSEELLSEISKLKEQDAKSARELDRLRNHLLQIEEGYTREALEAEAIEKDLRTRLAEAEEKLMTSSSFIESASQQASLQTESLQQQLHAVSNQRDQAFLQISSLQDQVQQYTSSLANLQMVLEQFQQEKESQVSIEIEHYQKEIMTLKEHTASLQNELTITKEKLRDAEEGIEAASRLMEQLDKKEETIMALKEEVAERGKLIAAADAEIQNLKKTTDSKVDKVVVRNLLLGYLTTSKDKQPVALRAVGGILDFTDQDFLKVSSPGRSWMPGFLRFGSSATIMPTQTPPTTPVHSVPSQMSTPNADKSFSELFVKFLEAESTPSLTMKLPAEEMVKEIQRQKESYKPAYNPFTAPRHVSMPGNEPVQNRGSPILMSQSPASPTINLFTPSIPSEFSTSSNSNPTSSSAILKDVLGSR